MTRCKRNLIVINFGNEEYDKKIRPLIDNINNYCSSNNIE